MTADAMRDAARWRRRATDTPGVTAIEFDTRSTAGWERRFYIRASDVAGRGLFTARRYAKGEYMTAYMGEDLGAIGSEEGLRGLERVENAKRADHVMEMRGRYVDGRHANAGAQYINSGGKRNNARFAHTGAVTATRAIAEGEEVLYPYGAAYWRRRAANEQRDTSDTRSGGMIAWSLHDDGRTVFVEELVVSPCARGKALRTGARLLARMLVVERATSARGGTSDSACR